MEIQNIVAYYKRLGKDEAKYVESFDNNIAKQYNDTQLRIISKFLPLNVRAVLEEQSPKYQQIMSFNKSVSKTLRKKKEEEDKGTSEILLKLKNKEVLMSKPVVIPSSVNLSSTKKLARIKKTAKQEEMKVEQPETVQQPVKNIPEPQIVQRSEQETAKMVEPQIVQPEEKQAQARKQQQLQMQDLEIQNNHEVDTNAPEIRQSEPQEEQVVQPVKRGRGRPRKNPAVETTSENNPVKRGRGRPRKVEEKAILPKVEKTENTNFESRENILPGFDDEDQAQEEQEQNIQNNILPGFDYDEEDTDTNIQNTENVLPGFEDDDDEDVKVNNNEKIYQENILPGFDEEQQENLQVAEEETPYKVDYEPETQNTENSQFTRYNDEPDEIQVNTNRNIENEQYNKNSFFNVENRSNTTQNMERRDEEDIEEIDENVDLTRLLTADKKIVTFVGTSKNGTSFIVNNIARLMANNGVNTAILDTTKNRNSYYIYTKNEEELRNIAINSIKGLQTGIANGINVSNNLTVYTSLPDENDGIARAGKNLETLLTKHSLILIDTDFSTPFNYFKYSQETYLVQSLDILTIQPLTAFLRELKARNILDESKLKIILNKFVKLRGINEKTIIGGMAYYNDPSMSYMIELFDRNLIKYISIPFDEEVYIKYLEDIVNCDINLKGYTKSFMQILGNLGDMIYTTLKTQKTYKPPTIQTNGFTPSINNTLDQMKKRY